MASADLPGVTLLPFSDTWSVSSRISGPAVRKMIIMNEKLVKLPAKHGTREQWLHWPIDIPAATSFTPAKDLLNPESSKWNLEAWRVLSLLYLLLITLYSLGNFLCRLIATFSPSGAIDSRWEWSCSHFRGVLLNPLSDSYSLLTQGKWGTLTWQQNGLIILL